MDNPSERPYAVIEKAGRWGKEFRVSLRGCNHFIMLDFVCYSLEDAREQARSYIGEQGEIIERI